MRTSHPVWGNFVGYADEDLLSFGWLYFGRLRLHAYYHIFQAVEKYLKALALSVDDPDGTSLTAKNLRWIKDHNLQRRLKPLFHGNVIAAQAYIYNEVQRQSAMLAYLDIIAVIAVMCGLIGPLVFLLGKMEPPKDGPAMH
jgi:hypothetical protein